METKRSYNIDLAKTIAYIGVVFLHVVGKATENGYSGSIAGQILYNLGTLAVPMFFVVNGYLLFGKKSVSYKYSGIKIMNILGVILGWNILYAILYFVAKHKIKNPVVLTYNNLLQKEFFYQFWFMGSLIICYLLLPILNNIWHRRFKAFIGIFLVALIVSLCFDIRNIMVGGSPIQENIIQTFRIWTWFMYYILGGIIKKINSNKQLPIFNPAISIIMVVGMLIYEYFIKYRYHTGFAEYNYDNLLIILTVTVVFIAILNLKIPHKFNTTILFLSQNGFGVYVLHIIFLKAIGKLLNLTNIWQNILGLLVVLIGSYLLTYIISKIKFLKKLVFR
ncbi:acyltransferase family protein [Latilactobacillus sakei]|nr:acyltransferase family protein [Latilactobacillus sakei]